MGTFIFVAIIITFAFVLFSLAVHKNMIRYMADEGYKYCGDVSGGHLWANGDEVRIGRCFFGTKLEKFTPIEIISLFEIMASPTLLPKYNNGRFIHRRETARVLLAIEIKYRKNGEIKRCRIRHPKKMLLIYADRLGGFR